MVIMPAATGTRGNLVADDQRFQAICTNWWRNTLTGTMVPTRTQSRRARRVTALQPACRHSKKSSVNAASVVLNEVRWIGDSLLRAILLATKDAPQRITAASAPQLT